MTLLLFIFVAELPRSYANPVQNNQLLDFQSHRRVMECKDDKSFRNRLGLSCPQHVKFNCDNLNMVGFTDPEVEEILNMCPKSCNKCKTINYMPSTNCIDISSFRDQYGKRCESYMTRNCSNLKREGYTHKQVNDLIANCPKSCGRCRSKKVSEGSVKNTKDNLGSLEPTNAPTQFCRDDIGFTDRLGLSCSEHLDTDCSLVDLIGFTEGERLSLMKNCRSSCGYCKEPSTVPSVPPSIKKPSSSPTSMSPTAWPTRSKTENPTFEPTTLRPSRRTTKRLTQNPTEMTIETPTRKIKKNTTSNSTDCKDNKTFYLGKPSEKKTCSNYVARDITERCHIALGFGKTVADYCLETCNSCGDSTQYPSLVPSPPQLHSFGLNLVAAKTSPVTLVLQPKEVVLMTSSIETLGKVLSQHLRIAGRATASLSPFDMSFQSVVLYQSIKEQSRSLRHNTKKSDERFLQLLRSSLVIKMQIYAIVGRLPTDTSDQVHVPSAFELDKFMRNFLRNASLMQEILKSLSSNDSVGFGEVESISLLDDEHSFVPQMKTNADVIDNSFVDSSVITGMTTSLVVFAVVILAAVVCYKNRARIAQDMLSMSEGDSTAVSSGMRSLLQFWGDKRSVTKTLKPVSEKQPTPHPFDDDRNERNKSVSGVSELSQVSSVTMPSGPAITSSTSGHNHKNKLKDGNKKKTAPKIKSQKKTLKKSSDGFTFAKEIQSFDAGSDEANTPKKKKKKKNLPVNGETSPVGFKEAMKRVKKIPHSSLQLLNSIGSFSSRKSSEFQVISDQKTTDLNTELQSFESIEYAKERKSPFSKLRAKSPVRIMSPLSMLSMSQFSAGDKSNENDKLSTRLNGLALSPRNSPPFVFQSGKSGSDEIEIDKLIQQNTSYGTRALNLNISGNIKRLSCGRRSRTSAGSSLGGIMEVPSVLKKSVSFSFASQQDLQSENDGNDQHHKNLRNSNIDSFASRHFDTESFGNYDNNYDNISFNNDKRNRSIDSCRDKYHSIDSFPKNPNSFSNTQGVSRNIIRAKTDVPSSSRRENMLNDFLGNDSNLETIDDHYGHHINTASNDEVFKVYFDDRGKLTFRLKSGTTNLFDNILDTKDFLLKSNKALQETWAKCKSSMICNPDEPIHLPGGMSAMSSEGFSITSEDLKKSRKYR